MSNSMEILIQPASAKDVPAIVSLHMTAFRNHFLTELGERFLNSYYHLVLNYPAGILMVAKLVDSSDAIGFVGGAVCPESFYMLMRRRRICFIIPLLLRLPRLLRTPKLMRRLFHVRRRVERITSVEGNQARVAELTSVAVNPSYHGQAVGKRLVLAFNSLALEQGAEEVTLTTDEHNNTYVNEFYIKLGFKGQPYTDSPVDRPMIRYQFCLIKKHDELTNVLSVS